MYALWAKNDYHNYFDKVEDTTSTTTESKEKKKDEEVNQGDIQAILSDIELKRARMRHKRDQAFLDTWNDLFEKEGSPGLMLRQAGVACLPLSWAIMAFFKYKRF